VRVTLLWVGLPFLMIVSCASPRERAYHAAMTDYKQTEAAVVDFARANVKQLVAATRAFHSSVGRWPQSFPELTSFALGPNAPLDPTAFSDVTFAALANDTLQVHYDVNCIRFSNARYQFTQTGSVNVKAK
jgi:hypothetical protein